MRPAQVASSPEEIFYDAEESSPTVRSLIKSLARSVQPPPPPPEPSPDKENSGNSVSSHLMTQPRKASLMRSRRSSADTICISQATSSQVCTPSTVASTGPETPVGIIGTAIGSTSSRPYFILEPEQDDGRDPLVLDADSEINPLVLGRQPKGAGGALSDSSISRRHVQFTLCSAPKDGNEPHLLVTAMGTNPIAIHQRAATGSAPTRPVLHRSQQARVRDGDTVQLIVRGWTDSQGSVGSSPTATEYNACAYRVARVVHGNDAADTADAERARVLVTPDVATQVGAVRAVEGPDRVTSGLNSSQLAPEPAASPRVLTPEGAWLMRQLTELSAPSSGGSRGQRLRRASAAVAAPARREYQQEDGSLDVKRLRDDVRTALAKTISEANDQSELQLLRQKQRNYIFELQRSRAEEAQAKAARLEAEHAAAAATANAVAATASADEAIELGAAAQAEATAMMAAAAELQNELASTQHAHQQLLEARLCVVCMDEAACIALIPCGHLSMCGECTETLEREAPVVAPPRRPRSARRAMTRGPVSRRARGGGGTSRRCTREGKGGGRPSAPCAERSSTTR